MINHFYATLFNKTTVDPNGVYNPLTQPLAIPDRLNNFYRLFSSNDPQAASDFALLACKIVMGSTYRAELLTFDRRLTFDPIDLPLSGTANQSQLLIDLAEVPAAISSYAVSGRPDLRKSFLKAQVIQEQAAALLVGVVEKVSQHNDV